MSFITSLSGHIEEDSVHDRLVITCHTITRVTQYTCTLSITLTYEPTSRSVLSDVRRKDDGWKSEVRENHMLGRGQVLGTKLG